VPAKATSNACKPDGMLNGEDGRLAVGVLDAADCEASAAPQVEKNWECRLRHQYTSRR
jgi:hypothetical protein